MGDKEQELLRLKVELRVSIPGVVDHEDELIKRVSGLIGTLLLYVSEQCEFHPDSVDALTIADEDKLGQVIYEWQDRAGVRNGYTGAYGGELTTAAKTVARKTDNGTVISSIVLMSNFIYEIVDVIEGNVPVDEWNVEKQRCLYILAHERGHAHDNYLRRHIGEDKIDLTEERDPQAIGRHYAGLLASEFLACFYAAKIVSPELQAKMVEEWKDDAETYCDSVVKEKHRLSGNAFYYASHNLWFVMVQFAKLIGHRCGNRELPRSVFWDYADECERPVFDALEEFLVKSVAPAPPIPTGATSISHEPTFDLDEYVFENLKPVWEKFCGCFGLEFSDEDDEDDKD